MKVTWTARGKARLRQIHAYIAQDQPLNANRFVSRLMARAAQLGEFPLSGRVVHALGRPDVREVIEAGYRIVYRVLPGEVTVLSVRDTRRVLPPSLWKLLPEVSRFAPVVTLLVTPALTPRLPRLLDQRVQRPIQPGALVVRQRRPAFAAPHTIHVRDDGGAASSGKPPRRSRRRHGCRATRPRWVPAFAGMTEI